MTMDELFANYDAEKNVTTTEAPRVNIKRKVNGLFPDAGECGRTQLVEKIVGGREAKLNEYPWLVKLEHQKAPRKRLTSVCSGSIINQRYVLTAAHCVRGEIKTIRGKLVSFRAGVHYSPSVGKYCIEDDCIPAPIRYYVAQEIVHDDYDIHQKNDIALIKSDRNIIYSASTAPVCLPDALPSVEPMTWGFLTVAGWGDTSFNGNPSLVKLHVDVPYVENDLCGKRVVDTQLCAGGVGGKDSCQGDSGGSLARILGDSWVIEGVVSYGPRCGVAKPAIYTRVRKYIDWIYDKVRL